MSLLHTKQSPPPSALLRAVCLNWYLSVGSCPLLNPILLNPAGVLHVLSQRQADAK